MGHGIPVCFRSGLADVALARCRFEVRRLAVIHHRQSRNLNSPATGSWPISTRRYSRVDAGVTLMVVGHPSTIPQSALTIDDAVVGQRERAGGTSALMVA
jgi:hypothetical protein